MNCFEYNVSCSQKFFKNFLRIYKDGKFSYKNENIERKYFKNMRKNQFVKVKNSVLELENFFFEFEDRELKVRKVKIR